MFEYLLLILGSFVAAAGFAFFILPCFLVSGGVSGIAVIINHLLGARVGIINLIINVPLFILARKKLGKGFLLKSLIATVMLSVFIDALPQVNLARSDMLLASIFGGALIGVGLALCFASGGSTGGIDILTKLILNKYPHFSTGNMLLILDGIIIAASMLVMGAEGGLYSILTVIISSKTIDFVTNGYSQAKLFWIISDNSQQISQQIMVELGRGASVVEITGAFTQKKKQALICLVGRQDVIKLKQIIKKADSTSFTFVLPANEVLGNGFLKLR